jgi:hypothetical protein
MKMKPKRFERPSIVKICTGKDLAEALERTKLTADEAKAWRSDLTEARKSLKRQPDKWK